MVLLLSRRVAQASCAELPARYTQPPYSLPHRCINSATAIQIEVRVSTRAQDTDVPNDG